MESLTDVTEATEVFSHYREKKKRLKKIRNEDIKKRKRRNIVYNKEGSYYAKNPEKREEIPLYARKYEKGRERFLLIDNQPTKCILHCKAMEKRWYRLCRDYILKDA